MSTDDERDEFDIDEDTESPDVVQANIAALEAKRNKRHTEELVVQAQRAIEQNRTIHRENGFTRTLKDLFRSAS